jgi:DNA invertase Pin-like site-specific DNA recombinase
VKTAYDDSGLSDGTMERPALQRLPADIRAQFIEVVVVYQSRPPHPLCLLKTSSR